MNEPWFDPKLYAWIPGTALGTLAGLWGGMVGTLVPQGRGKAVVGGGFWVLIAAGLACLAGAVAALATGQPYGIWYGLLLPGLMVPGLVGLLGWFVVRRGYRTAELRRMEAATRRGAVWTRPHDPGMIATSRRRGSNLVGTGPPPTRTQRPVTESRIRHPQLRLGEPIHHQDKDLNSYDDSARVGCNVSAMPPGSRPPAVVSCRYGHRHPRSAP